MKNVTVIVKPVGSRCNIACRYCYNRFVTGSQKMKMSQEVLERVIQDFTDLAEEAVRFVWHGGEPLLAGKGFYSAVLRLQDEARKETSCKIKNSIQTNGTLLNSSRVDFLTGNHFGVGISLDGPSTIHNTNRVYRSGKGTYRKVMQAIGEFKQRNVNFGVGSVITKANVRDPETMYRFFRENDIDSFDVSPCAETNKETGELEPYSVEPKEYASFLIGMFDIWMKEDNPNITIRTLNNMIRSALGGSPSLCSFNRTCTNILSVDYNGDISFCGRYMGIEEMRFGNIMEEPLSEILQKPKFLEIERDISCVRDECKDCEVEDTCKGGCTYHSYTHQGKIVAPNYFCETAKKVIPHIRQRVTEETKEVTKCPQL